MTYRERAARMCDEIAAALEDEAAMYDARVPTNRYQARDNTAAARTCREQAASMRRMAQRARN